MKFSNGQKSGEYGVQASCKGALESRGTPACCYGFRQICQRLRQASAYLAFRKVYICHKSLRVRGVIQGHPVVFLTLAESVHIVSGRC